MAHRAFYPAYDFWEGELEPEFQMFINPLLNDQLSRRITLDDLLTFIEDNATISTDVEITALEPLVVNETAPNVFEIFIQTNTAVENDVITFDGTNWIFAQPAGGVYTADNVNTGGIGVYKQTVANEFQFKGIVGANAQIVVGEDIPNNTIFIQLDPSAVDINEFSGNLDTSVVTEGSNLYYTDERAQDAVFNALVASGSDTVSYNYDDAGNLFDIEVIEDTSIQKVGVAKNGTFIGARRRLNFIEGSNTTLTITDNSINNRVDIIIAATANEGEGTVTSVALNSIPDFATATGSPITSAGTLGLSLDNQDANLVFAGPATGVADTPTFRSLVIDDIPDLSSLYEVAGGSGAFDEQAQDAVGSILIDTDTINLTYDDATPDISADVIYQMSITSDASGIKLVNDAAFPTLLQSYKTDISAAKGWYNDFLQYDSSNSVWSPYLVTQASKNIGGGYAENIFLGVAAGQSVTTGHRITIVGSGSNGFALDDAEYTSIFGYANALDNANGYASMIFGSLNDGTTAGTFNNIFGYHNLNSIVAANNGSASSNNIFGYDNLTESTGSRNNVFGYENLPGATTASDAIVLGNGNGGSITTANKLILIGTNLDGPATTAYQLIIGDGITSGGAGTWIDPQYLLTGVGPQALYYDDTTGEVTWGVVPGGGGGGAPTNAQYVTLATNGTLTDERVLTAGNNITVTDGGAGGAVTIATQIGAFTPNAITVTPTAETRLDDYNPTNWNSTYPNTATTIFFNGSGHNILGSLVGGANGRMVNLVNISDNLIIMEHQSANGTAANRFILPNYTAYFLMPNREITLIYNSTAARWIAYGGYRTFDVFEDFFTDSVGSLSVNSPNVGIATAASASGTFGGTGSWITGESAMGVFTVGTGTSASGRASVSFGLRSGTPPSDPSGPEQFLSVCKIAIPTLPDGTEDFQATFCMGNALLNAFDGTLGGTYWAIDRSVSTTHFYNVADTSGAPVKNVTGLALTADTHYILGAYMKNHTNAMFFYSTDNVTYVIENVVTDTILGGVLCGILISKSAGTTARSIRIDYFGASYNYVR